MIPLDQNSNFDGNYQSAIPFSAYKNLDLHTLFFVFYFQKVMYERFMAAKELKKRNWLFNKKHLIWLKIHEKSVGVQEFLVFDKKEWRVKKITNFEFDPSHIVHDI